MGGAAACPTIALRRAAQGDAEGGWVGGRGGDVGGGLQHTSQDSHRQPLLQEMPRAGGWVDFVHGRGQ